MVNVELEHNPYLKETVVKFNGQSPRINSQVEKYENQLLSDWATEVPNIFYNEMNGYDFDLIFSGTEYDFKGLNQAFSKEGVDQEQVRLVMRNKLENADQKIIEIKELLDWLKKEENRQFEYGEFYDNNRASFEEEFSCVIVRGADKFKGSLPFLLENVETVEELSGTDLRYIPVVFVCEERVLEQLRNDVRSFLTRDDIVQKQLFFLVSPVMSLDYITRFVCDLGIDEPQIITSLDDMMIDNYIKNYPMVEYVGKSIRIFEKAIDVIESILKEKNAKSAINNAELHYQIEVLDNVIERIKESDSSFVNLDNYIFGTGFYDSRVSLDKKIRSWNSKKTKIVGEEEINKNSQEYETELLKNVYDFFRSINEIFESEQERIEEKLDGIYKKQPLDGDYTADEIVVDKPSEPAVPPMKELLMELKEERYEEKTDLFDFFKDRSEPRDLVLVVTSNCENWREKASEVLIPIANGYIDKCERVLLNYYEELANAYHKKLVMLYENKLKEKNDMSSQLSEDEQELQNDNSWLVAFKDQLVRIERG